MTYQETYIKLESILLDANYRLDLSGHLSSRDNRGRVLYTSNVYRKGDDYYRLDITEKIVSIITKDGSRTIIIEGQDEPFNFEKFEEEVKETY